MTDSATTSPGKTRVTPQMVDAVLDIVVWHGQNQAGLAQYAGVSASTVSGIVKAKGQPAEYRKVTWDSVIVGLKQLMQSEKTGPEVDESRLKQHLSLLNIHEPRISLPDDPLDGSWDNYIARKADFELQVRLDAGQSALLCTKGGHKTGHSSLLREFVRQAEIRSAATHSLNLESALAFDANWDDAKFYEAITSGVGMDPLPADALQSPQQIAIALLNRFKSDKLSVTAIDGLQRAIMSNDETTLSRQAATVTQLPVILNRVVDGLQRAGSSQAIFLLAGPMSYYHLSKGAGIHQSRLLMKTQTTSLLSPDEMVLYFQHIMGQAPTEKQLKSMRDVLIGHPYLIHAALSDLRRGKSLPEEPNQFCHHDSMALLVAHLESTYRTLAACDKTLPGKLSELVDTAQTKDGVERQICVEIGASAFVNNIYKTLPPLGNHYFGSSA